MANRIRIPARTIDSCGLCQYYESGIPQSESDDPVKPETCLIEHRILENKKIPKWCPRLKKDHWSNA